MEFQMGINNSLRKKAELLFIAISIGIALFVLMFFVAWFFLGDTCMDNGGSWNFLELKCEYAK